MTILQQHVPLALAFMLGCADSSSRTTSTSNSYEGMQMTAELSTESAGVETVIATPSDVTVLAANGRRIGMVSTFEPQGSADEVIDLRVAEGGIEQPLIVVTTTLGGHRESKTYTSLYALDGRAVRPLFSHVTAETEDDSVREGTLLILPRMVVYRSPHSELPALFSFDANAREYVGSR